MTDEDSLDPLRPDEEENVAADLVWSVREELPDRELVTARTIPFEEAFHHKDDFAFTPWGDHPPLSHARILYRDELHDPIELCDVWVPEILLSAEDLARADGIETLDLTGRGGPEAKPYRATVRVHCREPGEEDRVLLELDAGAAVVAMTREYRNVGGSVVGVEERWLRSECVLEFVRNLPWERAVLSEFFPYEFGGPPDFSGAGP